MKKIILLLLVCGLMSLKMKASHIAGAEITYSCIGNNQYQVNLNLFIDCSGFAPDSLQTIYLNSTCGSQTSLSVSIVNPGGTEVSQICSSQMNNSACNGGNLSGMWVYRYTGTVTLAPVCNTWKMSWGICCRNSSIINLLDPDNYGIYVEASLNSVAAPCNNSPYFTNQAVPFVCANQLANYSPGIIEEDGDSLVYSLTSALNESGLNMVYASGYNALSPLPGITINPVTGTLSFTPTTIGTFVVTILVKEYKNGVLVGTVMRDMQFVVINCSGNTIPAPPSTAGSIANLSGAAIQTSAFSIELCEGSQFTFNTTYTDANGGNTLSLVSNISDVLPGATITTSGTNPLTATISWTATSGGTGAIKVFNIIVSDGTCPITGQQTFVYSVHALPRTYAGNDVAICGSQNASLKAIGGNGFNWSVLSGPPIIVGTNFSCNPCANPTALPVSTTIYEVISNSSGACPNRDTITVNVVSDFSLITVQTTDTLCLQQTVQLSVTAAQLDAYTYLWSPAEHLDNDTISNPTATINTPGSYSYNVSIVNSSGCSKTDSVTFVVLPSIRTLVSNDTILCGSQSAVLNVSGGSSFSWNAINGPAIVPGSNFSCDTCTNPVAMPSATTVYQVTSNLSGTCVNSDTVTVSVVSDFTNSITQSAEIMCLPASPIQLSSVSSPTASYTYHWEPSAFLSNDTISNPMANISASGIFNYVVSVTSPQGCVKKDTVNIIVLPDNSPNAQAYATDTTLCIGDTVQLGVTVGNPVPVICGVNPDICSATMSAILGTGTASNTSTTWPAPYGNWYTSAKHQFLFTATELNAAGITSGKINQIDFNVSSIPGGAITAYHEYTINMGCTSETALSNWLAGLHNVYTPKTHNVTAGWNPHLFDAAYEWDGVSNLVIEICFTEGPGTFGYSDYSYSCTSPYTTTSFISCLYTYTDASSTCPDLTAPNTTNNRPNVQFHYCDAQPDTARYTYNWFPSNGLFNANQQTTNAIWSGITDYYVVITDTVCGGSDTSHVTLANSPAPDVSYSIVSSTPSGGGFTICFQSTSTDATGVLWDFGDGQTSSVNNPCHTYDSLGSYNVTLTATNNCAGTLLSDSVQFLVSDVTTNQMDERNLSIFPNPNTGTFTVNIDGILNETVQIKVFDILGGIAYSSKPEIVNGRYLKEINLSLVAKGTYWIQIISSQKVYGKKVIIQN